MYRIEINGREFGVRPHSYFSAMEFASHQATFAGDSELAKQIRSRMDVPSTAGRVKFKNKITVMVERIRKNEPAQS